jgi:dephospho-CoA kinase
MDLMANLKDKVGAIFICGNICTGKKSAAEYAASYTLERKGCKAGPVSMGHCLRGAYSFNESTPREKMSARFGEKPEEPWIAKLVANMVKAEPSSIIVISGLRRQVDARYFFEQFPYSHFIALFADNETLVDRIVKRNRPVDFPQGTSEKHKIAIARQMLREEEQTYGINAMLQYLCRFPCKATRKLKQGTAPRGYIIDTSKQEGTSELEHEVKTALERFGIK